MSSIEVTNDLIVLRIHKGLDEAELMRYIEQIDEYYYDHSQKVRVVSIVEDPAAIGLVDSYFLRLDEDQQTTLSRKVGMHAVLASSAPTDLKERTVGLRSLGKQLRYFSLDGIDAAKQWLDLPKDGSDARIEFMDSVDSGYLGMIIHARPTDKDNIRVRQALHQFMGAYDRLHLLIDIKEMKYIMRTGFWTEYKLAFQGFPIAEKVAFIGNQDVKTLIEIEKKFNSQADIRWFDSREESEAIAWMQSVSKG